MTSVFRKRWVSLLFGFGVAVSTSAHPERSRIALYVSDTDAYTCLRALSQGDLPPGVQVRVFDETTVKTPDAKAYFRSVDVAVVDIMPREPGGWVLSNMESRKKGSRFYSVKTSARNENYAKAGILSDPAVSGYYQFTSEKNIAGLVRFLIRRDLGVSVEVPPPWSPPENALYHPDAPDFFGGFEDYLRWYKRSGRWRSEALWNVSVAFPTFCIEGKKAPLDALIRAYEKEGINTVVWLRGTKDRDANLSSLLSTPPMSSRLGSITGFDFRFSSILSGNTLDVLKRTDVPIFNAQYLFFTSGDAWRNTPQGLSPMDVSLQFSVPELSGLIEPSVVGVKETVRSGDADASVFSAVPPNINLLARRAAKWHALRKKSNRDKKVTILYYNHAAGKQNIGASYLNVFRSMEAILSRLRHEGYSVKGDLTEAKVKDLLLKNGRNIGSWAPGELDALLAEGNAVLIDGGDYQEWLKKTPPEFRVAIEKDWGQPQDNRIMMKDGAFVVPCVRLGHVTLVPQPVRGWGDDPEKLYHSTVLQPHHQYVAFYLWLQNVERPDALISLGTHGTHEWLPGKQAGLTWACPPEVLIGDLPNLYPYVVDDVGEGIQAKRRGRGVIIDHAVPPMKPGGSYGDYTTLSALLGDYGTSSSEEIRESRLERIQTLAKSLGLLKDMGISELGPGSLEKLEHYLLQMKTDLIPYGLHTFGVSPTEEDLHDRPSGKKGESVLDAMAIAMADGKGNAKDLRAKMDACGPLEMDRLVAGLRGGFIPPGPGNDPLRNPDSVPTGKNFFGFDPDKIPSREAWESGRKAAEDLIVSYREKHGNQWPKKIGVILWSVETIRNEGLNAGTALALLGMTPVWDKRDKVVDVAPILAADLQRPRIDVLIQMSGLFRDSFPATALLLDKAVRRAAVLTDAENFLAENTAAIEKTLIKEGVGPQEAKRLSLVRLFSAPPGAYGTKVDDLAGASGDWEKDDVVAEKGFIDVQSHGYSSDHWGEPMTPTYKKNLERIDATVHTRSSNLYGTMDNDDMFQYLGGLSMAVAKVSGKSPEVYVSMQKKPGEGQVEPLAGVLGRELRARYLNPVWIEGMKREGYAGAREMSDFVEIFWGWQVTTPGSVGEEQWNEIHETYMEDKNGLSLDEFFQRENPWAKQAFAARLLESVRKGYWNPSESVRQTLTEVYLKSVLRNGVACSDFICDNPSLTRMVAEAAATAPGLAPSDVQQFVKAMAKASGRSLAEQEAEKKEQIQKNLPERSTAKAPSPRPADRKSPPSEGSSRETGSDVVKGLVMETVEKKQIPPAEPLHPWLAALVLLVGIALFGFGVQKNREERAYAHYGRVSPR